MKILFMGRKSSGAEALRWTVANGFEVVGVLTDSHLNASPTAKVARENGIPILDHAEVDSLCERREFSFDLGISFVYWRILKMDLIKSASRGIINFHPAPLPAYKGTAGYNLAILRGLDEWACSAHYIDEGIDTGEIIDVFRFSIDSDRETAVSLEKRTQEFMLSLYKKTLTRAALGCELDTQPNAGGEYISRKQMEQLKLVVEGDDVDRKIRAFWFPPYSGATISIKGKNYTLINDSILAQLAQDGETSLR